MQVAAIKGMEENVVETSRTCRPTCRVFLAMLGVWWHSMQRRS